MIDVFHTDTPDRIEARVAAHYRELRATTDYCHQCRVYVTGPCNPADRIIDGQPVPGEPCPIADRIALMEYQANAAG